MPKAKSKAQAKFFGIIASGKKILKGFSKAEAKKRLEGIKMKNLPSRKSK
jgi:hypothetical protein